MIQLRNFKIEDIPALKAHSYPNRTQEDLENLIVDWNTKRCGERYFEMFAIEENETVVGSVSLYQHTESVVSCGVEIYPEHQRKGYAFCGVTKALQIATEQGYKIATAQVRTDNAASIALHKKLGFELDHEYKNKKGNDVYFFLKSLDLTPRA
ncbi:MAG: GNAT family N-acetyltransferase [Lachnospiraceae bacterium]|nr:GNAT family N-acetyltransferase [Lachnospiraceae bacterium]